MVLRLFSWFVSAFGGAIGTYAFLETLDLIQVESTPTSYGLVVLAIGATVCLLGGLILNISMR
jgi:hypothetical protein